MLMNVIFSQYSILHLLIGAFSPLLFWGTEVVFLFFFFGGLLLYNIVRFLPYIIMNQPQVYTCPAPLEPLSHLPSHPTPLGCHRALG